MIGCLWVNYWVIINLINIFNINLEDAILFLTWYFVLVHSHIVYLRKRRTSVAAALYEEYWSYMNSFWIEDSGLMGCDIVLLGEWFHVFWRDRSALNQWHSITSQKTSHQHCFENPRSESFCFVWAGSVGGVLYCIPSVLWLDSMLEKNICCLIFFHAVGRSDVPVLVNEKLREMHPVLEM